MGQKRFLLNLRPQALQSVTGRPNSTLCHPFRHCAVFVELQCTQTSSVLAFKACFSTSELTKADAVPRECALALADRLAWCFKRSRCFRDAVRSRGAAGAWRSEEGSSIPSFIMLSPSVPGEPVSVGDESTNRPPAVRSRCCGCFTPLIRRAAASASAAIFAFTAYSSRSASRRSHSISIRS